MNSGALLEYQHYYIDQKNDAGIFTSEAIKWGYAIALPIAGLLILFIFLSLGGIFAILGPCAIFIAARLITRHWNKKVRKIHAVEFAKDKCCNSYSLTESYTSKNIQ
jgi:hypothetical protein